MHATGTIENSRGFNPFELSKVFRQSDGEAMAACPKGLSKLLNGEQAPRAYNLLQFQRWKWDFSPRISSRPTHTRCRIRLKIQEGLVPPELSKVFRQSDGDVMSACPKKVLTNYGRGCKLSHCRFLLKSFRFPGARNVLHPPYTPPGAIGRLKELSLPPKGLPSC